MWCCNNLTSVELCSRNLSSAHPSTPRLLYMFVVGCLSHAPSPTYLSGAPCPQEVFVVCMYQLLLPASEK